MKALLLFAVVLSAAPSFAQTSPCASEAAAVCPKAKPGPERWSCMQANQAKLTPACRQHIAEMKARGEAFREDCKAEIGASCLNLQGHALVECLEGLGGKLSKNCSDRLSTMRGSRRAERIAAECKEDAVKLCSGQGAGGLDACLRANAAKLSKECGDALK
jgi:hypothetical protein